MHTHSNWYTTAVTTEFLKGALEVEQTEKGVLPHRLPGWVREQYPDPQLLMAESQPAGVRLEFQTSSTAIEIDAIAIRRNFVGAPPRPKGIFDLVIDGQLSGQAVLLDATTIAIDMSTGTSEITQGPVGTVSFVDLPERVKNVEIWLPHNETVELVELRTNAPVEMANTEGRKVWLHHGSSISQGSNATNPTGTWPALAAASAGVDLVNLGFSGSALLDPFIARAMRDTPADLLSVKMGINIVGGDLMRRRAFGPAMHGFLDTLRDGHPETPLLIISPTFTAIHEDTPGPSTFDLDALREGRMAYKATGDPSEAASGKLTLEIVRDELARIVSQRAAKDPNIAYLDGLKLYGAKDFADLPLPDELHPDAAAHHRIAKRFSDLVFKAGGAFAQKSLKH